MKPPSDDEINWDLQNGVGARIAWLS